MSNEPDSRTSGFSMSQEEKETFMKQALLLARRGWGETHPNPMVGAVLVQGGRVLAEGFHERAGEVHAEVAVLRQAPHPIPEDAVLFITLEPCSTSGRTGPCTEAIRKAGVRRVVVGALDPNPKHAGQGIELLKSAGVQVETGILREECEDLNLIFTSWVERKSPLLAAKVAMTLDGKIACRSGQSRWITGEESRADVMRWRRLFPAIAVGAGTVVADNPRLTSRIGDEEWCPIRFVFDGVLRTSNQRPLPALYTDEHRERTIIVTTDQAGTGYVRRLENDGLKVWCLPSANRKISFEHFKVRCREEDVCGVYFEGGAELLSGMLQVRAIDYLFAYQAPVLFADEKAKPVLRGLRTEAINQGIRLHQCRHAVLGEDHLMRGHVGYPEKMDIDEIVLSHVK